MTLNQKSGYQSGEEMREAYNKLSSKHKEAVKGADEEEARDIHKLAKELSEKTGKTYKEAIDFILGQQGEDKENKDETEPLPLETPEEIRDKANNLIKEWSKNKEYSGQQYSLEAKITKIKNGDGEDVEVAYLVIKDKNNSEVVATPKLRPENFSEGQINNFPKPLKDELKKITHWDPKSENKPMLIENNEKTINKFAKHLGLKFVEGLPSKVWDSIPGKGNERIINFIELMGVEERFLSGYRNPDGDFGNEGSEVNLWESFPNTNGKAGCLDVYRHYDDVDSDRIRSDFALSILFSVPSQD